MSGKKTDACKETTRQAQDRADFAIERIAPYWKPILGEMRLLGRLPQNDYEWACLPCGDLEDAEKTRMVRLATAGGNGDSGEFDRIMAEFGAIAAAYFRAKAALGGGAG